jgi:hypothetical protein
MNIRKIPFVAQLMLAFTILLPVVHADEVPAAMAAAAELKQDTIQASDSLFINFSCCASADAQLDWLR